MAEVVKGSTFLSGRGAVAVLLNREEIEKINEGLRKRGEANQTLIAELEEAKKQIREE